MSEALSSWAIVSAKPDYGGEFPELGWIIADFEEGNLEEEEFPPPDYDILTFVVKNSTKSDAVRAHTPWVIAAINIPQRAMTNTQLIRKKIHECVGDRDETKRPLSEISADVQDKLNHLFDQFV